MCAARISYVFLVGLVDDSANPAFGTVTYDRLKFVRCPRDAGGPAFRTLTGAVLMKIVIVHFSRNSV